MDRWRYYPKSEKVADLYLLQRMNTKKDASDSKMLHENFSFDYMGSSEFEWGAIPHALRQYDGEIQIERTEDEKTVVDTVLERLNTSRMIKKRLIDTMRLIKVKDISYKGHPVKKDGRYGRRYEYLTDEVHTQDFYMLVPPELSDEQARDLLTNLVKGEHRLKERFQVEYDSSECTSYVDTWMGVDYPILIFREKKSYYLFLNGLKNTIKKWDEEKKKEKAGA